MYLLHTQGRDAFAKFDFIIVNSVSQVHHTKTVGYVFLRVALAFPYYVSHVVIFYLYMYMYVPCMWVKFVESKFCTCTIFNKLCGFNIHVFANFMFMSHMLVQYAFRIECLIFIVPFFTTWGLCPQVVPRIEFSPTIYICLFVCHTYISSIHVVSGK